MKMSPDCRKQVTEEFEGLIFGAYDDMNDRIVKPGGHVFGTLTIGYGHTSAAGPPHVYVGMTITKEQADAILSADLASVELNVLHHLTREPTQHQFDAMVDFDFNTGALARSSILTFYNHGDVLSAANAFRLWTKGNGNPRLPGLVRRREAERSWFLKASQS